jgi:hypothetical protein
VGRNDEIDAPSMSRHDCVADAVDPDEAWFAISVGRDHAFVRMVKCDQNNRSVIELCHVTNDAIRHPGRLHALQHLNVEAELDRIKGRKAMTLGPTPSAGQVQRQTFL